MKRATGTAAQQLMEQASIGGRRVYAALLTLTYRDVDGWRGRHLVEFWRHVRGWAARRGFPLRYVWVSELQQRGAVHYHAIVWLPKGVTLPKPDKQGWWPHGSTRIEWAIKPVGYLVKYASKGDDVEFPKGLRIHGRGGLDEDQRAWVRWWCTPRYVRLALGDWREGGMPFRVNGGGWCNDWGEFVSWSMCCE